MTAIRKLVASFVLGLVLCLALFTTGAFAHTAFFGHHHHFFGVQVSSVAIADPGFFGLGGCFPFFDGAFAHANVHIFGDNFFF
ncbi:MAG TPA: hypothetical protein VHD63_01385 [Ktedonobacteraceae bacterium]|nr:hypothetical protein [Ktedonobacteraceae bacterium]